MNSFLSKLFLTIFLSCILIFAFKTSLAWSETDTPVHSTNVGGYTNNGEFSGPYGIARSTTGYIYIADAYNHRIQVLDENGVFQFGFGSFGTGVGQFNGPYGLTLDASNNVYVADRGNSRIQVFNSLGVYQFQFGSFGTGDGQFDAPYAVDVDSSGNIHVVDFNLGKVQVFNNSGVFQFKFATHGSADGQIKYANGIDIDSSGKIYIADKNNRRVEVFNSSGIFQYKFGSLGSADGQFSNPRGIALDGVGNIYIADTSNHRIQVFNNAGVFQYKFGSFGNGDGQFNNPYHLLVAGNGDIYVTDNGNHRVQVFNNSGTYLRKFGSDTLANGKLNYPAKVTTDVSGNTYVSDTTSNRIQVFNSNGEFVRKFGTFGSGDGQFSSPNGVAVNSIGEIYVADYGNNRIQVFSSEGVFLRKFGTVGTGDGQFSLPGDIFISTAGTIYVADSGNSRVQVFNSSEVFQFKFGIWGTTDGLFKSPFGIKADATGNIYVADTTNNRIQIFNSAGVFQSKFGASGTGNGQFNLPYGVSLDSNNNIYVADTNNSRIQKFDSLGNFIAVYGNFGVANNNYAYPQGVHIGADGTIYVADTANNRIQLLKPDKIGPSGDLLLNNGAVATGETNIVLNITAADELSTVEEMIISEEEEFAGGEWVTFESSKNFTLTPGEGSKTVYVKFVDYFGNFSAIYSDTIVLDQSPPTGSISINEGESTTGTTSVILTLSAVDSLTSVTQMILSESNSFEGADWETFVDTVSFSLTEQAGTKTVYAKFRDSAGNESVNYSDEINLDSVGPVGTVTINNAQTYSKLRMVELTLAAVDAEDVVSEMMISESETFEGAVWETYTTTRNFELTEGEGAKTVYAKFRDSFGNVGATASDFVVLDTVAPSAVRILDIGLISNLPNKNLIFCYFVSQTPRIKGTAEAGSEVHFKQLLSSHIYSTLADNQGNYRITLSSPILPRGTVELQYYAEDAAGNRSSMRTLHFVIGVENFTITEVQQEEAQSETPTPSIMPSSEVAPTVPITLEPSRLVTISEPLIESNSSGFFATIGSFFFDIWKWFIGLFIKE